MRRILPLLVLLLLIAAPAAAQVKSPFASGLNFTQADIDAILAATKPFFADAPAEVGAQRGWNNPASGLSGTARYEGENEMNDSPCRKIHHLVRNEKTNRVYEFRIDRCQAADGSWQIVAGAWMAS